jgi:para-nitrobenzyl esterase
MHSGQIIRASDSLAFFAYLALVNAQSSDPTIVKTESGVEKNVVPSWKAIPYAAAHVVSLRWHMSRPPVAWTGVREVDKFGPACMQTDDVLKSEDRLFLNVWRPATDAMFDSSVMDVRLA